MKYSPLELHSLLFGDNHFIYNMTETEDRIDIYLKSRSHSCKCPDCGMESHKLHSTYKRVLQDMPIRLKKTYVHANIYKYDCVNPECSRKVFMEKLPFAHPSQVRTDSLNTLILSIAMFLSNEGTSRVLSLLGITVSNDAIQKLIDRIDFQDDPNVEGVGIDDVAIRKGQKYATIVYDLKDHHMIALLEGRDSKSLKEWLKTHPKIRVVARDRASAYALAINEILPECVQVADRFHLMQNLLEKLKEIFYKEIPSTIFIKDGKILEKEPKKIIQDKEVDENKIKEMTYDNTPPVDKNGVEIIFNSKKRDLSSNQYKKQAENRKKNNN